DTGVSANVGVGAWGASAHVNAGFNKVDSESAYTKEEMAARAGLRSSVDLAFRTDQIPLDKFANEKARAKIDNNARVPINVSDSKDSLLSSDRAVKVPDLQAPSKPKDTDSDAATKARQDAAKQKKEEQDRADKKEKEAQDRADKKDKEAQDRADKQKA